MSKCISCDVADLQPGMVQLQGAVRGEIFSVEMKGLVCSNCGYKTIDGADMPEYGRLLADKYRAAHGLLTSDEVRARRERLGLSQQNFADYLQRGVASVKRWEMGKIQDPDNDRHIREMTDPKPVSTMVYVAQSGQCNICQSAQGSNSTVVLINGTVDMTTATAMVAKGFCSFQTQRNTSSALDVVDFSSVGSAKLHRIERLAHAREH
jgi:putative zinc finger/helix-turn-helix YgiT family protein